MTFINNTAGADGAAIYAIDIQQCVYAPSLNSTNASTIFEGSIFQLKDQFIFRYITIMTNNCVIHCNSITNSGNRVLSPNARNTEALATSPFTLTIEPRVSMHVYNLNRSLPQ